MKPALEEISLFHNFSSEALKALQAQWRPRTFPTGASLFHRGDPADGMLWVEKGRIRVFVESEAGREVTLAVRGPGSVVGEMALLDGQMRSASCRALDEVRCWGLARESFDRFLMAHPEAMRSLLATLSQKLREAGQQVEELALKTIRQRLALVLLRMVPEHGEPCAEGILLSREVNYELLVGLLGTIRESVSRAMAELVSEGLVQRQGRRFILTSLESLQRVVEE